MLRQLPFNSGLTQPTSKIKTIVFDNEVNFSSQSLQYPIANNEENVNMQPILHKFEIQRSRKESYNYRVFDPTVSQYITIPESGELPQYFFMTPMVMIKYKKAVVQSDTESSSSFISTESRKERNKQRTIREVIDSVKRWRDIHNAVDHDKNRVSLQEAAKMIGISKKSLDDYFYQLRLGEQFNFSFQSHMDDKIGVLRAFVRKHKPIKETTFIYRHPKRLKIIQDIGLQTVLPQELEPAKPSTQQSEHMITEQSQLLSEEEKPIPFLDFGQQEKIEDESEMRYYDSFLMDNEPSDPFVSYREMDFKKKHQDFSDEFDMTPW